MYFLTLSSLLHPSIYLFFILVREISGSLSAHPSVTTCACVNLYDLICCLVQAVKMANHQAQVNCVGSQAFVTVNNGSSGGDRVRQPPTIRHVTVTPLVPAPTARVTSSPITLRKLKLSTREKKKRKTLVKSLL